MGMPAIRRHWTTVEVRALMGESRHWPRYELLGGELLVTPAPGLIHQIAVGDLLGLIGDYVEHEQIGIALSSPADIELRSGTIIQPDVFVVPSRVMLNTDVPPGWRDVTALLLAVEIVSPSSARSDRVEKRDHYLDAGVPDYWVVDLDARMVECWTPLRATPVVESARLVWLPEGTVRPFVVDLSALFKRIWRKSREGR